MKDAITLVGDFFELQKLVCKIQCCQYGDLVNRDHAIIAAYFAHAGIEKAGRCLQAVLFARFHADGKFPIQDFYIDRCTHAFCSSDLRRLIIASTRERASSLLLINCERSLVSYSWLCRRLRFSSSRRRDTSIKRSMRSAKSLICWWVSGRFMVFTIVSVRLAVKL